MTRACDQIGLSRRMWKFVSSLSVTEEDRKKTKERKFEIYSWQRGKPLKASFILSLLS